MKNGQNLWKILLKPQAKLYSHKWKIFEASNFKLILILNRTVSQNTKISQLPSQQCKLHKVSLITQVLLRHWLTKLPYRDKTEHLWKLEHSPPIVVEKGVKKKKLKIFWAKTVPVDALKRVETRPRHLLFSRLHLPIFFPPIFTPNLIIGEKIRRCVQADTLSTLDFFYLQNKNLFGHRC
jgi:hypothetical protein